MVSILSIAVFGILSVLSGLSYVAGIEFDTSSAWHGGGTTNKLDTRALFSHGGVRAGFYTADYPKVPLTTSTAAFTPSFGWFADEPPRYPLGYGTDITGKPDVQLGLGFAYHDGEHLTPNFRWYPRYVVIPCWFLLLLCVPFPCLHFRQHRRDRKVFTGYCKKCGYNLRASKDRCPECGSPFSPRLAENESAVAE
jgi:hypothetical protein